MMAAEFSRLEQVRKTDDLDSNSSNTPQQPIVCSVNSANDNEPKDVMISLEATKERAEIIRKSPIENPWSSSANKNVDNMAKSTDKHKSDSATSETSHSEPQRKKAKRSSGLNTIDIGKVISNTLHGISRHNSRTITEYEEETCFIWQTKCRKHGIHTYCRNGRNQQNSTHAELRWEVSIQKGGKSCQDV